MNKIAVLGCFLIFPLSHHVLAQITVSPGTTLSVSGATNMTMAHDLTISNGGTMVADGNVLMQAGNFTNNGAALFNNSSSLIYIGGVQQQLNAAAPLNVANLVVNNPAGVTTSNAVTITSSLGLSNGNLYADSTTPVYFANSALYPTESNNSRIVGRAVLDPITIGAGALNFLGCNIAAGADMGTVSIVRNSGPEALVIIDNNVSIAQSWIIASSNNAASPSRNVTFSWLSAVDNNRDMTAIFPFASKDSSLSDFTALAATGRDVSSTDPRVYQLPSVSDYNRLFTFADHAGVGVKQVTAVAAKVNAFPNPFGSVLSLSITKGDNEPVTVRVTDMNGRVVLANTYKAGNSTVIALTELGNLAVGSYLVQVYNDNFGKSLKIVKAN